MSPSAQRHPFAVVLAFAILCAPLAFAATGIAGELTISREEAGIPNFGQTNENYFRGGQPDRAAFERLDSLGIKTVINLRDDAFREEPTWVQKAGMQYYNIPLSDNHPATEAQTAQFLDLVNDPHNWPVYVHCAGGRHRAGEMTAIYRITHDNWTADQAFKEMQQYDWYSFPFHGPLKTYVYQYYDSQRLAAATKSSPPANAALVAPTNSALSGAANP